MTAVAVDARAAAAPAAVGAAFLPFAACGAALLGSIVFDPFIGPIRVSIVINRICLVGPRIGEAVSLIAVGPVAGRQDKKKYDREKMTSSRHQY
jgi:hypothetical protein